jgi:predicted alpha/beta superfamily hydrolase
MARATERTYRTAAVAALAGVTTRSRALTLGMGCAGLLFVGSTLLSAQDTRAATSFTLRSTILNEDRGFQIYVPRGPGATFDAVYVLDGQAQFSVVVDALKAIGLERTIVVGVGNIWSRDRDYTPTRVSASSLVDATAAAVSGGGENFVAHLERELIPYVNSHYPAGPSRILVGHSLGGLLGVTILLNHPGMFEKFVIVDPSMWWDGSRVVAESTGRLRRSFGGTSVFLAIANARRKDRVDIDAVRADTSPNTDLIRPSVLLLDALVAHRGNGIRLDWRYYQDHEHMTVFHPAVKDGLAFVLR